MKLGRRPRVFDSRIPRLTELKTAYPPAVNYLTALPDNTGDYYNNTLGDCTCAALYHAIQIWSANTGVITNVGAFNAVRLYERTSGYQWDKPETDQGGIVQSVLAYVLNHGAPVGPHGRRRNRLSAYVEISPSHQPLIQAAIYQCGVVYIGFTVPAYLMNAGAVWTVQNTDNAIIGGHAVAVGGYDGQGVDVISWGAKYRMTWEFFFRYVDEAYALADRKWFKETGKTLNGLTLAEMESLMDHLRA
jgi:hypothetical protein